MKKRAVDICRVVTVETGTGHRGRMECKEAYMVQML